MDSRGDASVPKIIINDTITFVLKLQSDFGNFKPQHFPSAVWKKMLPCILVEIYIDILALEMASPRNWYCANCSIALSFPIAYVVLCTNRASNGLSIHLTPFSSESQIFPQSRLLCVYEVYLLTYLCVVQQKRDYAHTPTHIDRYSSPRSYSDGQLT